jgi:8-oxo-dGTP pyrophosphatase MutT (NUDIX family)
MESEDAKLRSSADPPVHQAGAIAYRVKGGRLKVLLLTSRETGRWIIPKGNIEVGETPAAAALREAYEEAGVTGVENAIPLGFYTYFKRLRSGETRPTVVEVYLLRVTEKLKQWPEKEQRRLGWFSPPAAASIIGEPGILPLLRRVEELEPGLLERKPKSSA